VSGVALEPSLGCLARGAVRTDTRIMQSTRFPRRLVIAAVVAGLLAFSATAEAAQTGTYWAPHANCYTNGVASTTIWLDKIGLGPQQVGYNLHFYDLDRGRYTFSTGWQVWNLGYGRLATPLKDYRPVQQGRYWIYAEIGWNLGSGWGVAGAWAGSYLTGGDYFGIQESFCRATPQLQVVGGSCNSFGGVVACASRVEAPAGKRVRAPRGRAGIERLQRSRHTRRLMRRDVPASPAPTLPPAQG
jgi:hypothetical protein